MRQTRLKFQEWGREGGHKRAQRLTRIQRSKIASKAAKTRWNFLKKDFQSVRWQHASYENPTYLQEILSEGNLNDWKILYEKIADGPFGIVATSLEKALRSEKIYGVTPLWQNLLNNLRGGFLEK